MSNDINTRVKRHRKKLKQLGWKRLDLYLPEELKDRVLAYKQSLVDYYKLRDILNNL